MPILVVPRGVWGKGFIEGLDSVTRDQLFTLASTGADVSFLGSRSFSKAIDFAEQRLAADDTLLPETVSFQSPIFTRGTLYRPGGGPVDGTAFGFGSLSDVTLEGGYDLTDAPVDSRGRKIAAGGYGLTVDGGVIRNGALGLLTSPESGRGPVLRGVHIENATVTSTASIEPLAIEGGLTVTDGLVRGREITVDGDVELQNGNISGNVIQLQNTSQITGSGTVSGRLDLQHDLITGPDVLLDLNRLKSPGYNVTVHGRLEIAERGPQVPEQRSKLEAKVLTLLGEHTFGEGGTEITADRLVFGRDSTTTLALDPDPDAIGDPADYRTILLTGTAELDGDLVPLVRQIDDPANVGLRSILIEADAVTGTFDTVAPPPAHFTDGSGLTYAVLYTATTVEVEFALIGDGNLNQQVEQGDLDLVLSHWGQTGATWATGDLNGNGTVEQGDLDAVLSNWGNTAAPDFAGTGLPEPGGAALLGAGAWLLAGRTGRGRGLA